jgi:RNA polymerase sigma-70 factor (ECF subfamily)
MTSAPSTFEDSTLIKLALRGQVECFAALRDRHIVAVRRRISSMLRNTHDVDDLLQEVFLKAWCHLSTFRSESTFRTWIIRVATNEVLQSYRREKRRSLSQDLDLDILPYGGDSPHESVARSETTRTVRRAVATLPSKYRQVLILRDLEELSERETAQSLELGVPAVKTRLFRARLMLLAALRRQKNQGLVAMRHIWSGVP